MMQKPGSQSIAYNPVDERIHAPSHARALLDRAGAERVELTMTRAMETAQAASSA